MVAAQVASKPGRFRPMTKNPTPTFVFPQRGGELAGDIFLSR